MSWGQRTGEGFGGQVEVIVSEEQRLEAAWQALRRVVARVDKAANRFDKNSELSQLNTNGGKAQRVSPLLWELLQVAVWGAKWSQGTVDPTVGNALVAAGYDRDFSHMAKTGKAVVARSASGWKGIEMKDGWVCLPPGVQIDLGASAKAYASDWGAVQASAAMGEGSVLVNCGGDIALGGEKRAEGWVIQVSEDSGEEISDQEEKVMITEGALATSSVSLRQWKRGEEEWQHILDPRTGKSAKGKWRTASVVAGNCVIANIAATAAIVMGEAAERWLKEQGLSARLVSQTGIICRVGGWPGERVW